MPQITLLPKVDEKLLQMQVGFLKVLDQNKASKKEAIEAIGYLLMELSR